MSGDTCGAQAREARDAGSGVRVRVGGSESPPPEQPPPRIQSMMPSRAVARVDELLTQAAPVGRKERSVMLNQSVTGSREGADVSGLRQSSRSSSSSSSSSSSFSNKSSSPSHTPRNSPTKTTPAAAVSSPSLPSASLAPLASSSSASTPPTSCQASRSNSSSGSKHIVHNPDNASKNARCSSSSGAQSQGSGGRSGSNKVSREGRQAPVHSPGMHARHPASAPMERRSMLSCCRTTGVSVLLMTLAFTSLLSASLVFVVSHVRETHKAAGNCFRIPSAS